MQASLSGREGKGGASMPFGSLSPTLGIGESMSLLPSRAVQTWLLQGPSKHLGGRQHPDCKLKVAACVTAQNICTHRCSARMLPSVWTVLLMSLWSILSHLVLVLSALGVWHVQGQRKARVLLW